MVVSTSNINGIYSADCEGAHFEDVESTFFVSARTQGNVLNNTQIIYDFLDIGMKYQISYPSLLALIENGIAQKLPNLPRVDGNYLLWKTDLNNGYSIGVIMRVMSNGTSMNNYWYLYGPTEKWASITHHMDANGNLDDEYKAQFSAIGTSSGGSIDETNNMYVIFFSCDYKGKNYYGFFFFTFATNQNPLAFNRFSVILSNESWQNLGQIVFEEHDTEYGNLSTSGGYGGGSFDNSSDAFGVPQMPSVGVTSTGFINVYNPSLNQLSGLAEDLFPDIAQPTFDGSGTLEAVANNVQAVGEVIGSFAECFINQNLIQYVIDCHIVPCVPQISENNGIKVGFKTFNYSPAKVTNDYVTVDCGTLEIAEYYQNFLDYVGTKAKLFLPFVGFVDIKNEWFQSGRLHVVYHYNVIDGSFMAFILATSSKSKLEETVVGSYGGNCCVHIPITGTNYASMISGVVQGTAKAVTSLATANLGGVASGVASAVTARPSIEQSNGYNSNSAYMGIRIPYLLIERPVASFSKNYPHENGLPLNVTKKLSDVNGFTVCKNLHVDNIDCTQGEKDMIKALFASGVIL